MIRNLLKAIFILGFLSASFSVFAATVINTSVLPVSQYTRITLESDQPLKYSVLILSNPSRIVLDVSNAQLNTQLKNLTSKNLHDDPYIKQIRVAKFKKDITRIVLDLKEEANANVTAYVPAGDYQHRLAIDVISLFNEEANSEAIELSTNLSNKMTKTIDKTSIDKANVDKAKEPSNTASKSKGSTSVTGATNNNGTGIVLEPEPVFEQDDATVGQESDSY
jgi:AMIN domain